MLSMNKGKKFTAHGNLIFLSPLFCSDSNHKVIKPGWPVTAGLRVVPSRAEAVLHM